MTSKLLTTVKHNDLIYDVGLHRGQDTDFYLKKGFRVIAFEANPENAAFCRQRFCAAIKEKKLTIVEGAIANENLYSNEDCIKFYRNKDHSLWGSANPDWARRNEVVGTCHEVIAVKAVRFSDYLKKFGLPFYLKADIVGSEKHCLKALLKFEQKPDYLSIRSEKLIFKNLLEEFRLLQMLGYEQFKAIQQDFTELSTEINKNGNGQPYIFEEGASGLFGEETRGNWKNLEKILKEYKRIFVLYWLFGDYSYLNQTRRGKKFISNLERVFRRPMPGWYDTHAKHSSNEQ